MKELLGCYTYSSFSSLSWGATPHSGWPECVGKSCKVKCFLIKAGKILPDTHLRDLVIVSNTCFKEDREEVIELFVH